MTAEPRGPEGIRAWLRLRRRELRYFMAGMAALAVGYPVSAAIGGHYYMLNINLTESLPYRVSVVDKTARPGRGELLAFTMGINKRFPPGTVAVKIVGGLPGDAVTMDEDRYFYVNGQRIGRAKALSRKGEPLALGPTGRLPAGHYFAYTPHPDSYDSRYADIGWITPKQVVGRASILF